jgi:phage baseplate assembly protein W
VTIPQTYGIEWSTFSAGVPDLDPTFSLFGGDALVVEAAARRLITPRGSLPGCPDYGYDLTQHVQARLSPVKLAQIRTAVISEITKDERVVRADCEATPLSNGRVLRLVVGVQTRVQKYRFVLTVSQVSVELLRG